MSGISAELVQKTALLDMKLTVESQDCQSQHFSLNQLKCNTEHPEAGNSILVPFILSSPH